MKSVVLTLPIGGNPDKWPDLLGHMLRSDHAEFWKANLTSLFNTDTAEFRGVMRRCYHKMCDHPSQFSYESYEFLAKQVRALVSFSKDKCGKCSKVSY